MSMSLKEAAAEAKTRAHDPNSIDYVLVFSLTNEKKAEKAKWSEDLSEEYKQLTGNLERAGFKFTSRKGAVDSELLILVRASEERIALEMDRELMYDWLHEVSYTVPKKHDAESVRSLSPAQRLRYVEQILTRDTTLRAPPNPRKSAEGDFVSEYVDFLEKVPVVGLWENNPYYPHVASIFPKNDEKFSDIWFKTWAGLKSTWSVPLDELTALRDVFGEELAMYFAFLKTYFVSVGVPAVLGTAVWLLNGDAALIPVYIVFLSLWATAWCEIWKKTERSLAVEWNTLHCTRLEKHRQVFTHDHIKTNAITGETEYAYSWPKAWLRQSLTLSVIGVFSLVQISFIFLSLVVETIVAELEDSQFKQIVSLVPSVINAGFVSQFTALALSLSLSLSSWENHPLESLYLSRSTLKMFALNAVVAYAPLLLTVFVYYPYGTILVPRLLDFVRTTYKSVSISATHTVDINRLHTQYVAFVVTGQIISGATQVALPYAMLALKKYMSNSSAHSTQLLSSDKTAVNTTSPSHLYAEEDELLEPIRIDSQKPDFDLFTNYLQMAIQFGYIVMFSVIWPIAPLLYLVNNFVEIRSDSFNAATTSRRRSPGRAESIGPWNTVFSFTSHYGVAVSASIYYLLYAYDIRTSHDGALSAIAQLAAKFASLPERSALAAANSLMVNTFFVAIVALQLQSIASAFVRGIVNQIYGNVGAVHDKHLTYNLRRQFLADNVQTIAPRTGGGLGAAAAEKAAHSLSGIWAEDKGPSIIAGLAKAE